MRFRFFILVSILALATIAVAQEPRLKIETVRENYYAGERVIITAEIETFGIIDQAEIEIDVSSPEGKFLYGDLVYTQIPHKIVMDSGTGQTEQVLYHEDIDYLEPGKIVRRYIDFEIPIDVETGIYTINMKLTSPEVNLEDSKVIYIGGRGEVVDFIIIIYIVILVLSLYLLLR